MKKKSLLALGMAAAILVTQEGVFTVGAQPISEEVFSDRTASAEQGDLFEGTDDKSGIENKAAEDADHIGATDAEGINSEGINSEGINSEGINAEGINAADINAEDTDAKDTEYTEDIEDIEDTGDADSNPGEEEDSQISPAPSPEPTVYEEGWVTLQGHKRWQNTDGSFAASSWKTIDGKDYYFDSHGYMAVGWIELPDGWYYLREDGVKAVSSWIGTCYVDRFGRWDTSVIWHPAGWQKNSAGWWWQNTDGSYPCSEWKAVDGIWYYFNASGYMVTGWQMIGGSWYYFDGSGHMLTGWQYIRGNWYYMEDSGRMATGWRKIKDVWYYLAGSGSMVTGWQYLGGCWYYLNSSGGMVTGWQKIGGVWYYMRQDGGMATGWQKVDEIWYYLDGSGRMLTGWQRIGGSWYYLDASGQMATGWRKIGGVWYYLNPDGDMATGWQNIDDDWYYFTSNGDMAANTWIGPYYVNGSGAWEQEKEAPDYVWPCPGNTQISSDYGYRYSPTAGASSNHKGIDIAAAYGQKVVACSTGTVTAYGYNSTMGNYVKIRHTSQLTSVYMHMSGFASGMQTGKTVSAGETIGFVGSTGVATGPHLHFAVMVNDEYVNPWNYLTRP